MKYISVVLVLILLGGCGSASRDSGGEKEKPPAVTDNRDGSRGDGGDNHIPPSKCEVSFTGGESHVELAVKANLMRTKCKMSEKEVLEKVE